MNTDATQYFLDLLIVSAAILPIYYLVRSAGAKRMILIAIGVFMVFTVSPRQLFFWIPYWVIGWMALVAIRRLPLGRIRAYTFVFALAGASLPMLWWKLDPQTFLTESNQILTQWLLAIAPWMRPIDRTTSLPILVGLSFSTFRMLDLLICAYLDLIPKMRLADVLFYGFYAPVLVTGPIAQYSEFDSAAVKAALADASHNIGAGAFRILVGFAKVILLAGPLAGSHLKLMEFAPLNPGQLWYAVFCYTWYLYLNFSGFSDIALGTARLFGYRLRENFRFPFFRRNLSEFWANWHISLSSFAQRNVFVPLGGFRVRRQYAATAATMMVIALWHDVTGSLVLFGLLHSIGLIALRFKHRYFGRPQQARPIAVFGATLATFGFVALTIPLLVLPTDDIAEFYRSLIGLQSP